MYCRGRIIIVVVLLQFFGIVYAQPDLLFEHLGTNDGLPNSYVNSILQDDKGFMWFATRAGLVKYDGFGFFTFEYVQDDTLSLPSNQITSIIEDQQGDLWIGTYGGGLCQYNYLTNTYTRFDLLVEGKDQLSSNKITNLLEDSIGNLWIAMESGGLCMFNTEEKLFRFNLLRNVRSGIENIDYVHVLYEDNDHDIWIGTDNGLIQYNIETNNFSSYLLDTIDKRSEENWVTEVSGDSSGKIYFGTGKGDLYVLDKAENTFDQIEIVISSGSVWRKDGINSLYLDDGKLLYIGTWDGLIVYNMEEEEFSLYNHNEADPNSLSDGSIMCTYKDKSGILWFGTADGGINKLDARKNSFGHVYPIVNKPGSLSNRLVTSICKRRSGELWIGTTDGLNRLSEKTNMFDVYLPEDDDPNSISHYSITALYEDKSGVLWIGTGGGGLNRWDDNSGTFTHYFTEGDSLYTLTHNNISSIVEAGDGKIWVATEYYGINVLDPKSGEVEVIENDIYDTLSLSSDNITTLYIDGDEDIWVGTRDGGLDKYDSQSKSFYHYGTGGNGKAVIKGKIVYCIYKDSEDILWVGTDFGINKINLKESITNLITKEDGLLSNSVYGIIEDYEGNIWLSTNYGLAKLDKHGGVLQNFTESAGLQGNEFRPESYFMTKSGELYFGGNNGYNHFYAENIIKNLNIPTVEITNFKVFSESRKLTLNKSNSKHIELSFKDNFFTIEFAALDFSSPMNNQLAYSLDGVDKEWNYIKGSNRVSYTNINPGAYVFMVKGSNNHGIWNDAIETINIIISPPYWMTWWFRALSVLVVSILIYGLYRYRIKTLNYQKIKLEKEVKKRTIELIKAKIQLEESNIEIFNQKEELHIIIDHLRSAEAQMLHSEKMASIGILTAGVAHEINNPLNYIEGGRNLLSEHFIDKGLHEIHDEIKPFMGMIEEGVDRICNIVSGLNRFSRKNEAANERCNIALIVNNCLAILQNKTKGKIEIEEKYSGQEYVVIGNEGEYHQAILNVLTNAIQAIKSKGKIIINTSVGENCLILKIIDNGCGITKENIQKITEPFYTTKAPGEGTGLGLSITYAIMERHSGSLIFKSEVGVGTEVILRFNTLKSALLPDIDSYKN